MTEEWEVGCLALNVQDEYGDSERWFCRSPVCYVMMITWGVCWGLFFAPYIVMESPLFEALALCDTFVEL